MCFAPFGTFTGETFKVVGILQGLFILVVIGYKLISFNSLYIFIIKKQNYYQSKYSIIFNI